MNESEDDPQIYEKLCVQHDTILPIHQEKGNKRHIDPSILEQIMEAPSTDWDQNTMQKMRDSLNNRETIDNFKKYLYVKPHKKE